MPYKIIIEDHDTNKPIAGKIQYTDSDGNNLGETIIPAGGMDISGNLPQMDGVTLYFSSPGYYYYSLSEDQLYDETTVLLTKKPSIVGYVVAGGIFGIVLVKLFGKKAFT